MSDISVDISAIYRISGVNETIFDTESHLQEKSRKIGKYRRYFGEISESDRNIGRNVDAWETRAREFFFFGFFGRYIADISKISARYRRYFRYIGRYIGALLLWLIFVVQKIRRSRSNLLFKRLV